MILNNSKDLVNKEKRKQERAKTVHRFALGVRILAAAGAAISIIFVTRARKKTQ